MKVDIVIQNKDEINVKILCKEENEQVRQLARYLNLFEEKIYVKKNMETVKISIRDIYYIESVDGRTFLYGADEVYETGCRLFELEERLDEKVFIRSSKSQIINISYMKSLKPELNRTMAVMMKNGEKLIISRRCTATLKKILGI